MENFLPSYNLEYTRHSCRTCTIPSNGADLKCVVHSELGGNVVKFYLENYTIKENIGANKIANVSYIIGTEIFCKAEPFSCNRGMPSDRVFNDII